MTSPEQQATQPAAANLGDNTPQSAAAPAKPGMPKRWLYAILVLAFLFVLMPYLFWQATWFGKPLNDEQMGRAFSDVDHPREVQHALSQLADRMLSPDPAMRVSAKQWYPRVLDVSSSPDDELRLTSAWVMQQDNTVPEFHATLARLLADNNPMVARNAALALVRFNDPAGHDLVVSMLQPAPLTAPAAGKLVERASVGDSVTANTLIGKIEDGSSLSLDVRAPAPGKLAPWSVSDGANVSVGQPIGAVNPSPDMVWEALRALYIIGTPQDARAIEPYTQGGKGMPPQTAQQASQTLEAIKSRAARQAQTPKPQPVSAK